MIIGDLYNNKFPMNLTDNVESCKSRHISSNQVFTLQFNSIQFFAYWTVAEGD